MTCKQISAELGVSIARVRLAAKRAGFVLVKGKGVVSFNKKQVAAIKRALKEM